MNRLKNITQRQGGFSAIETVLGAVIFVMVSVAMYTTYARVFKIVQLARARTAMVALANEEVEKVRNMPYADIGEKSGIPRGNLPSNKTVTRGQYQFAVDTTVRNIDDPFDGQIGSTTNNDLSPADSKLLAITVTCNNCAGSVTPVVLTTRMGPKGLESASTNGALFIQVLDANGLPVEGANIHVVNASSSVVIDDLTNAQGMLQIIDAPPGVEAYQVTATKAGYTTERTFATGSSTAPNPTKVNPTVLVQQLTQITLTIDRVSTVNFSSVKSDCSAVPNIDFTLAGTRLLSSSPDVLKYSKAFVTDGGGVRSVNDLEWDTYALTVNDTGYDLAGTIPLPPLNLAPGSTQDLYLVMRAKDPKELLVTVKDSATQLPISDAKVEIEKGGATTTLYTGRGFLKQTDWSGGLGQATTTDLTKYWTDNGRIDNTTVPGELRLQQALGVYTPGGTLESSTFDSGSASNFYEILTLPSTQHVAIGLPSARFQFASGNNGLATDTWVYKGPDGTNATYYTATSTTISAVHNGDRYFRYKVFLDTASTTYTPTVTDVSVTFTSNCAPPGQVYFDELSSGVYNITVSKSGYSTTTDTVSISSSWQQKQITLSP